MRPQIGGIEFAHAEFDAINLDLLIQSNPNSIFFFGFIFMFLYVFTEAVNLELVNLNKTPTSNGHRDNGVSQKKKDTSQVEMGNSYNEYFVPVNEHKKYMRYFLFSSFLF